MENENQSLTLALKGIAEIIDNPGIINIDVSDIVYFIKSHSSFVFGSGEGCGERRVTDAIQKAFGRVSKPFLVNFATVDVLVYLFFDKKDITLEEIGIAMDCIKSKLGGNGEGTWILEG